MGVNPSEIREVNIDLVHRTLELEEEIEHILISIV